MLAITFPGQGSQRPGMGRPWVGHESWRLAEQASEVIGRDVARLLLDADAGELRLPANAQLATLVLSAVVLAAVRLHGALEPEVVAGHSLGEYTALVAANALTFEDAVGVVAARGQAMDAASSECPGTMYAVLGLDDEVVEHACRSEGEVWVANYNSPGQVVIAGRHGPLDAVAAALKGVGAKVMPLPVGGAFHTPLMASAGDALAEALGVVRLRPPDVPVISNVDATPHEGGERSTERLCEQLCRPVQWRQTLERLDAEGVLTYAELGPGSVLTGLARRTLPGRTVLSVTTPEDVERLVAQQRPAAVKAL